MDFALHDVFSQALNEEDTWATGLRRFYMHFSLDFAFSNPQNLLILTENHDTQRFNKIIKHK